MAYAGSKRSKDDFSGDDEVQEKPPSKVARAWPRAEDGAGDSATSASYGNVEHWMRMQQLPKAAADMAASNALNFQQRVMAAAALQEIRSIDPSRQMFQQQPQQQQQQQQLHPPSSFKFQSCQQQLDSALLEHQLSQQPPTQSPMRMQSNLRPPQVFGELDSNLGMVSSSGYLPVVSRPSQMPQMGNGSSGSGSMPLLCDIGPGDFATSSSSRLCGGSQNGILQQLPQQNGILQQMQQKNGILQQMPQQLLSPVLPLPPAPGFLGRDPPSWFPSIKDAPVPSFPDLMPSLAGIPPMPMGSLASSLGGEFLDQQLQMPLQIPIPVQHQHQHASSSPMSYGGGDVLSSNGYCGASAAYGTASCSSSSQAGNLQRQTASSMTKMLNQCNNQASNAARHLTVAPPAAAAAAGGNSYCSSELAASSVTSVHNAAASSSASMQNGSPEDSTPVQRTTNQHKQAPTRTYTKVYKLGSIGRAVDVTRFNNYTELRWELARMFGLEGQLDQKSGWQLVFIDHEGDILLVGDDPWEEFVTSVRGIRILSPSEVAFYTNNEDKAGAGPTHSCLTSTGF